MAGPRKILATGTAVELEISSSNQIVFNTKKCGICINMSDLVLRERTA